MTGSESEPERSNDVPSDLAWALSEMSQVLLAAQSSAAAVTLVTALAVETMPDTVGAGVTLVDEQGKRSWAASDLLVEQADALQYQFDAGPCLTAWRDLTPVGIYDIAAEVRWPEWTDAVARLGIRSMLSVPLLRGRSASGALGAIKVYSDQPGAYDASSERVLSLFAEQAAVLLANAQTVSDARKLSGQLTTALSQRDVFAEAIGILLSQGTTDVPTAMLTLRSAAKRSRVAVDDVAQGVVAAMLTRNAERPPVMTWPWRDGRCDLRL